MSSSRAAQELGKEVLSRDTSAKVLRQREYHHSAKRQKEPLERGRGPVLQGLEGGGGVWSMEER